MPFPYAYYQDNYTGPIHATRFKANGYVSNPVTPIISSGDVDATEQSVLNFNTSGSNIIIDSLIGIQNGQLIYISKMTTANSLTLKNISPVGTGSKFYTSTGTDIVLPAGSLGGTFFIAIQDSAVLKLYEIRATLFGNGSAIFPSVSFAQDIDTGLFSKGADQLGFATAGIERLSLTNNFMASLVPFRASDGTNALPSLTFGSDNTTGFYKTASAVGFSYSGIMKLLLNSTGSMTMATPELRADTAFKFQTTSATSQQIRVGSLLSSDIDTDSALVPVNGIYSKGNVRTGGQFIGTATSSLYADLAEIYESDLDYIPGTLVKIGGSKEITLAQNNRVFGVISTRPGFLLNAEEKEGIHLPVALSGKVPCRVVGFVAKGDKVGLHPTIPGVAGLDWAPSIGIALEDKNTEEEGLVMIATRAVI